MYCGCDRGYVIEGKITVARGAGAAVMPAVLCEGKGGPLMSSALYAHPATQRTSSKATIFCKPPAEDVEFPLDEEILQGALPRRAHAYAWLEPVPAAKPLCGDRATIEIGTNELDQLMEPDEAKKPRSDRGLDTYPCGHNPVPGRSMTYAVTFDPDHKTWVERKTEWVEHRDLRIEK